MLVWVQVPSPAYAEVAELADAHGSGPCGSTALDDDPKLKET